jgi:hypothetical protein
MPTPPGTQLLRQGALGRQFQVQLVGEVLPLEFVVVANVGGDHLADLAGAEQLAQAKAIDACVVADDGQAFFAGVAQGGDQGFRDAAQAEAAHRQGDAVADDAIQRRRGAGVELVHYYRPLGREVKR